MTELTRSNIKLFLKNVMKKAEKLSSIEEKRKCYFDFLANNIDFLDLDEEVDLGSDEIGELISEFLYIEILPIVFEDGYTPWLDSERKNIAWDFYNRYEEYLYKEKKWKVEGITSLKKSSDIILDHMANPKTKSLFDKKGLVIGDIQSGKTANYTALINKALDAGYKIVIVLAGLTRDLRNQTQKRLDMEVLGFETKIKGKGKSMGVGLIKPLNIEGLTYADDVKDFGDMKKYFSTHTLDDKLNPIVAVVKKNGSVLDHLDDFLTHSMDHCYTNGKLDIPVLIIDDEVDQASVDTKGSENIENASAINGKIRTILSHLNRSSYVGYTATPFANVFVNSDIKDIYPKDFILTIPTNDEYCGIKEYFGVDIKDEDEYSSDHSNDLFVNIDDYISIFGDIEKIDVNTQAKALNPSLTDAIKSFIIAASIKKSRGIIGFNSMLIHIARYKNPATTLKPIVENYINELYHAIKYENEKTIEDFYNFWNKEFKPVSKSRLGSNYHDEWDKIKDCILSTIESTMNNIIVLNGDSGDMLDYSSTTTGDYIVIGGDKLSRGLTLEGLVVSYYYRKSKTYDSLLQMGRWFGYRKGWIDVCRVFTTVRFMNDFITVGKVLQKFKNDIIEMNSQHLNPRDVGQRIMYSPNLIPTTRNKMKTATKMKVSFSGEVQQIITFNRSYVKDNFDCTSKFVKSLGKGDVRSNNKVVFKNVDVDLVLQYLKHYKECSTYYGFGHISIGNWIKYIENLKAYGELTNWTVVINSLNQKKLDYDNSVDLSGYTIFKPSRMLRDDGDSSKFDLYTIKANIDPTDFAEFFDPSSKEYDTVDHYDSKKDYPGFTQQNAVMSIYVIDLFEKILTSEIDPKTNKIKAKRGNIIGDGISVCAPAIWFSKTEDYERSATEYFVSKDYLEKENKELEEEMIEIGE